MYSSLYLLLWQSVLAYEAGRLMVCWVGSKMSKNIQPTTLPALPWPGGALSYVKHRLQGYLKGRYYALLRVLVSQGNLC